MCGILHFSPVELEQFMFTDLYISLFDFQIYLTILYDIGHVLESLFSC